MTVSPFADIAVALRIEASELSRRAEIDEQTSAEIGLFEATRQHIIAERRRQAELIAEAYRLVRALMPVEHTVRAVIREDES